MKTFLSSLDVHSAQLIKLYRSRSGKLEKDLKVLLDCFDEKVIKQIFSSYSLSPKFNFIQDSIVMEQHLCGALTPHLSDLLNSV